LIPDDVVRALNAQLDDLPEDQQRMLLVIQEVGMRGGELCEAPFDCLLRDNDGDYFFLYYQGKMRKEHHVPISRELARVVKEQQAFMRKRSPTKRLGIFLRLAAEATTSATPSRSSSTPSLTSTTFGARTDSRSGSGRMGSVTALGPA
jgi:integrase